MLNQQRTVRVVPSGAAAGAQVQGIDLTAPLDDDVFRLVESALDEHGVICLRDQSLTPAQQVAFGRRFGEPLMNFNSDAAGLPDVPEIFVVSNVVEDGRNVGVPRVGEFWHTDMCYVPKPPRATILYALEVPRLHGLTLGDTVFANAAAAWQALPDETKAAIADLKAVFDFRTRKRRRTIPETTASRFPPAIHPMVRTHPRTGRKSLYVVSGDCQRVEGMDAKAGLALIEALSAHIVKPAFQYRHQWRPGDVLVWDNCTVQHRAIVDYELPQRRLIHRLTVAGGTPF